MKKWCENHSVTKCRTLFVAADTQYLPLMGMVLSRGHLPHFAKHLWRLFVVETFITSCTRRL